MEKTAEIRNYLTWRSKHYDYNGGISINPCDYFPDHAFVSKLDGKQYKESQLVEEYFAQQKQPEKQPALSKESLSKVIDAHTIVYTRDVDNGRHKEAVSDITLDCSKEQLIEAICSLALPEKQQAVSDEEFKSEYERREKCELPKGYSKKDYLAGFHQCYKWMRDRLVMPVQSEKRGEEYSESEKALLWLANYKRYKFTYLLHRNIFYEDKLTIEEVVKLYKFYVEKSGEFPEKFAVSELVELRKLKSSQTPQATNAVLEEAKELIAYLNIHDNEIREEEGSQIKYRLMEAIVKYGS